MVLNACPEDSGVYTCTARNLAGSVSCKAELTVHEGKIFFPVYFEVLCLFLPVFVNMGIYCSQEQRRPHR